MDAKPMSFDYNETVSCWSLPCIRNSLPHIGKHIHTMDENDPARMKDTQKPFVVAEYGCATGYSSIETLTEIIRAVKKINVEMPILIYLNDLPTNHHDIALKTISEGLFGPESVLESNYRDKVYLYIAGKDFTKDVFPPGYVDFGYSNMASNTLPNSPSPLTNCYFFASDEVLKTEGGQKWVQTFEEFLKLFIKARYSELRTGGIFCMVTQCYSVQPEIQMYHQVEEAFYQNLYNVLSDIFKKYRISEHLPRVLYTWTSMRRGVHERVLKPSGFETLQMLEYTVPDCFHQEPNVETRIKQISDFQRGYWAQTVRDSLLENSVDPATTKQVVDDIFNEEIPKYISANIDNYPEKYCGLCYFVKK